MGFAASSSSSLVVLPPKFHILPNTDLPYKDLQNHQSLTLLTKCKTHKCLKQVHTHFIKFGLHNTQFALSKLIEFCAVSPYGNLSYALQVFDSIEEPNHIICNTILRGHSLSSTPILAICFFIRMVSCGYVPNSYTFPFLLKSCAKIGDAQIAKQIHGHVLKFGFANDAFVHTSLISTYAQMDELGFARSVFDNSSMRDVVSFTALITGYTSRGFLDDARELFDEIPVRDVVSWNAMISGYTQSGEFEEALSFYEAMRRANVSPNQSTLVSVLSACAQSGSIEMGNSVRTWIEDHGLSSNIKLVTALIDMYSKCGDLSKARELFDGIQYRDVISWNAMIGGYVHANEHKEALILFRKMQDLNEEPNDITFLSILPACAYLGAVELGKWIHACIDKDKRYQDFTNVSLWTSVVDMYAKCGNINAAVQVFTGMKFKSVATYNAMISGLAMHGRANVAFNLFSKMINEGFKPDDITFIGILSACSHAGSVDLGRRYFQLMKKDFGISPKLHHYGCLIDLLGRAGLFDEVDELMKKMEMSPDAAIWGSLLGACRVHKKVELGEFAAKNLFKLEPANPSSYILLSNIYASVGKWEKVAEIRTKLNDKGMRKVPGSSSIEIDSTVHEFLVGDKSHPKTESIYKMLDEIDHLLKIAGFLPDTSEVLYDMNEEWKKDVLCHHSEKLAIAFGLISTKPDTTIRIVKNLRVCSNCHTATKLMSKIFNREIIARDRNRFHHFKDGSCSCMDYW